MREDFKLNVFFCEEGEELETVIANYLIGSLEKHDPKL